MRLALSPIALSAPMAAMNSIAPKRILHGLQANHFRHPLDLEATATLRQLPGLDLLIRTALGPIAEQVFYLDNISSSVLVSDLQLPELHQLLQDACQILDLEPPELYVRQHPVPNAYTFAMRGKQPFIVIHTSLIDLLTPAEIQAVMAHELGHLKCDHSVYLTLANLLTLAASQLPFAEWLVPNFPGPVDGMGSLCRIHLRSRRPAGNPRCPSRGVPLMKLSGGSPSLGSAQPGCVSRAGTGL
jgi:Zn-dependent protease with chaperone function